MDIKYYDNPEETTEQLLARLRRESGVGSRSTSSDQQSTSSFSYDSLREPSAHPPTYSYMQTAQPEKKSGISTVVKATTGAGVLVVGIAAFFIINAITNRPTQGLTDPAYTMGAQAALTQDQDQDQETTASNQNQEATTYNQDQETATPDHEDEAANVTPEVPEYITNSEMIAALVEMRVDELLYEYEFNITHEERRSLIDTYVGSAYDAFIYGRFNGMMWASFNDTEVGEATSFIIGHVDERFESNIDEIRNQSSDDDYESYEAPEQNQGDIHTAPAITLNNVRNTIRPGLERLRDATGISFGHGVDGWSSIVDTHALNAHSRYSRIELNGADWRPLVIAYAERAFLEDWGWALGMELLPEAGYTAIINGMEFGFATEAGKWSLNFFWETAMHWQGINANVTQVLTEVTNLIRANEHRGNDALRDIVWEEILRREAALRVE